MSETLIAVRALVNTGDFLVSAHADEELRKDEISLRDLIAGVQSSVVVEDYPNFGKGPCVLVLQRDAAGAPIHVLWGLRKSTTRPIVMITAYRPDPPRWSADFLRRQQ